jgi:hypothetical protein
LWLRIAGNPLLWARLALFQVDQPPQIQRGEHRVIPTRIEKLCVTLRRQPLMISKKKLETKFSSSACRITDHLPPVLDPHFIGDAHSR